MRVPQILTIVFLALSVVTLNAVADTQAFKCTAEDGKISYLDTRPTRGCVTIEVVSVNVGKGTPGDGKAAGTPEASTDPSDPKYDKEVVEKQAEMKKDCDARQANLKTLKTSSNVQTKGEDGKPHRMSAEEQVKMAKDIQDYLDQYCSDKK